MARTYVKHNRTNTPEYTAWHQMKSRCIDDPLYKYYEFYAGRGIKVCDRWLNDFQTFFNDVGVRPSPQHSLDRYPNKNGNYEPGNVRWATDIEQQNNMRSNRLMTLEGVTHTTSEWCKILGLKRSTIGNRLYRGWSDFRTLTEPMFIR